MIYQVSSVIGYKGGLGMVDADGYEEYMKYENFVRLVGCEIYVEEAACRQDPLWIHNDLSKRLLSIPRHDWVAFSYDDKWGLLLVYKTHCLRGVVYRGIDAVNAAIMVQYVSVAVAYSDVIDTVKWFTSGYGQVTVIGMHLRRPYLIRNHTNIPFPPPRAKPSEKDN